MAGEITTPLPSRLSEEDLYDFDTRGFLLRKGFVSAAERQELLTALARRWEPSGDSGLVFRAQGLPAEVPCFGGLLRRIVTESGVYDTINQPFRLIESYALRRVDGSLQALHNGRSNDNVSAFGTSRRAMWRDHTYHDGLLHCMMVKALVYLTDITSREDGPFVVVEGSHKANYPFPVARRDMKTGAGMDRAGVHPVYTAAGDLLLLNEALTHGSLAKSSGGERAFLAFSFAPSFVGDYAKLPRDRADLSTIGFCE